MLKGFWILLNISFVNQWMENNLTGPGEKISDLKGKLLSCTLLKEKQKFFYFQGYKKTARKTQNEEKNDEGEDSGSNEESRKGSRCHISRCLLRDQISAAVIRSAGFYYPYNRLTSATGTKSTPYLQSSGCIVSTLNNKKEPSISSQVRLHWSRISVSTDLWLKVQHFCTRKLSLLTEVCHPGNWSYHERWKQQVPPPEYSALSERSSNETWGWSEFPLRVMPDLDQKYYGPHELRGFPPQMDGAPRTQNHSFQSALGDSSIHFERTSTDPENTVNSSGYLARWILILSK